MKITVLECKFFVMGVFVGVIACVFGFVIPQRLQKKDTPFKDLMESMEKYGVPILPKDEFSQRIELLPAQEKANAWMAYSGACNLRSNRGAYKNEGLDFYERKALETLKDTPEAYAALETFLSRKYDRLILSRNPESSIENQNNFTEEYPITE